jgi:hypothetical protein
MHRRGGRNDLKETQERVLALFRSGELRELTRRRYQELTGVSRSQAAYDLAELVAKGILRQDGAGRATSYRLAREEARGHRRWTQERIRAELVAFCAGRQTWPTAGEFKAAERGDLYVAASRYGGIAFWTAQLGFSERRRDRRNTTSLRRRLAFAALAAAVVTASFVAMLVARHGGTSRSPRTAARSASPATTLDRRRRQSFARQLPQTHASTSQKPKPGGPRRTPPPSSTEPRSALALAAQPTHVGSSSTSAPRVRRSAGEPAPLAAPARSAAPAPLAAP